MIKLVAATVVGLTATVVAAPPKGAFKIVSVSDGKNKVVYDDVFKQGKARGEIVLEFDGKELSVGLWVMAKATDAQFPNQALISVCRAGAVVEPPWAGDSFTLVSKVRVKAWGDSHVVNTAKANDKTTTTTWTGGASCDFSLDPATFKVVANGDKLTITDKQSTMQLVRTTPLEKVDTTAIAKDFARAK